MVANNLEVDPDAEVVEEVFEDEEEEEEEDEEEEEEVIKEEVTVNGVHDEVEL